MPVPFIDLAQTCAPAVVSETLAGIVSLESRFAPLNIQINSGLPLKRQPTTKAEAIEIATSLAAERQDIQLGLGGLRVEELQKLSLSMTDAFDPCLNLQATATLLDGYYRLAVKAGADPKQAERVMVQSWYGRDDPAVEAMVRYDQQVRQEIKRLGPTIARLTIGGAGDEKRSGDDPGPTVAGTIADVVAENARAEGIEAACAPAWDVFNRRHRSSVLVFQNNQSEVEQE